jgi:hypothetical protein
VFEAGVEAARSSWQQSVVGTPAEAVLGPQLAQLNLSNDAARVDDCVARFAAAEIAGFRLGRSGPLKIFPSLGEHVGSKLGALDPEDHARVLTAIAKGVGVGYVAMASIEDPVGRAQARTPREIWDVWVPGLNSGLAQTTAMPPDMLSIVRESGGSAFQADAAALRLAGFGKKRRLAHIGAFYAQAGVILRAIQVHEGELRPDLANQWAYDDHPPPT